MKLPLVIVPVFNALEHVESCLSSLARTVPADTRVLLIDDASTDQRVLPVLRAWVNGAPSQRTLLENKQNQGFVRTANIGLQKAEKNAVLLNSDTEVTTGWLQKLASCLASDPVIATATPWSNNGEIVSIPAFCQVNPRPPNPDAVAAVVAGCGEPLYPELPTAVGFCMAVSARGIRQVGLFDEHTFGHGYGEENDYCQRAAGLGMKNVLCDDAYVVHHGNASFGPIGLKPDENSMQRLLSKHPGYLREVQAFIQTDPLAARRDQILAALRTKGVGMG